MGIVWPTCPTFIRHVETWAEIDLILSLRQRAAASGGGGDDPNLQYFMT